ncbi:hypothetical protein [Candidatus Uabimicrobium amorphum]|uniref:Uncharacterized protein n=2 Tax=Uabimicrobium amorphum TaxID=2596890 RepID=A0A5S9F5G2_UABAM|nr:hypothetical protein UABAM_05215 [Candidatus Uabimicrobium amorphum]
MSSNPEILDNQPVVYDHTKGFANVSLRVMTSIFIFLGMGMLIALFRGDFAGGKLGSDG